jgi:hypothetical protein
MKTTNQSNKSLPEDDQLTFDTAAENLVDGSHHKNHDTLQSPAPIVKPQTLSRIRRKRRRRDDLSISMNEHVLQLDRSHPRGTWSSEIPTVPKSKPPAASDSLKTVQDTLSGESRENDGSIPNQANDFQFKVAPKTGRSVEELNALFELPESQPSSQPSSDHMKGENIKKPTDDGRSARLDPGFMPSEANGYKFEYGSKTGRSAEELNALFEETSTPLNDPSDYPIKLSYRRLGDLPPPGLADKLVARMERLEELHQRKLHREQGRSELCDEPEFKDVTKKHGRTAMKRSS